MKLIILLLFFTIMQVSAAVYGQKLTLKQKNVSIARVFEEIEKQTGYDVFYSPKVIKNEKIIHADFRNTDLTDVLKVCLQGQAAIFTIDEKTIIIKKQEEKSIPNSFDNGLQNIDVVGRVFDENNNPLVGATIKIKGSEITTTTNKLGDFLLSNVNENAILIISYIGYENQEITAKKDLGNIKLTQATAKLSEVTVTTSYGLEKRTKELGYSVTKITGEDLNRTNPGNLLTGLTGKVSGLVISNQGVGMNPDNNIMLRGIRSINASANNQPLFILNGSPLSFGSDQNAASLASEFLNNLNPNDIEDITVLKGANGSALYGPEGVNGVIIINTKKGAAGKLNLNFRTSTTLQQIDWSKRKIQETYGTGQLTDADGNPIYDPTGVMLWGPAFNGEMVQLGRPDENGEVQMVPYQYTTDRQDFWNTARQTQNNLSIAQADASSDFYLGLTYTDQTGLLPKDKQKKAGILFNTGRKFDKWAVRLNLAYNNTSADKGPANLSTDFYPAHVPLLSYKDYVNNKWADRNHYWADQVANPYETVDNKRNKSGENALIGNIEFKLTPLSWLTITERPGLTLNSFYQKKTTKPLDYSDYAKELGMNGRYISFRDVPASVEEKTLNMTSLNNDFLVSTIHNPGNFSIKTTIGNTIRQSYVKDLRGSAPRLITPVYNLAYGIEGEVYSTERSELSRFYSFFGTALIGYQDKFFVEITGRNDWDSKLAIAARNKNFYSGVNTSIVLQEIFPAMQKLKWLSNARLRAAFTKTANMNIRPYQSERLLQYQGPVGGDLDLPGYSYMGNIPNPNVKPESVFSQEYGGSFTFLKNRIDFDVAYYRQRNKGLILDVVNSIYSGAPTTDNAGVYDNWGWEFDLNFRQLFRTSGGLRARLGLQLAINDNKVVFLPPVYNNEMSAYSSGAQVVAKTGSYAFALKLRDWKRDEQGRVIVDKNTGMPSIDYENPIVAGRTLPKHTASANFGLSWKGFNFSALGEYRGGNHQYNEIGATTTQLGSSLLTTYNNRQPFVVPNSVYADGMGGYIENTDVKVSSVRNYWMQASSVQSNFLINAAFFTLRELSLSYDLQLKTRSIKKLTLGVYGRDLLTVYAKNNAYGDPQLIKGPGSERDRGLIPQIMGLQNSGSNLGNAVSQSDRLPGTIQYGFIVNLNF